MTNQEAIKILELEANRTDQLARHYDRHNMLPLADEYSRVAKAMRHAISVMGGTAPVTDHNQGETK